MMGPNWAVACTGESSESMISRGLQGLPPCHLRRATAHATYGHHLPRMGCCRHCLPPVPGIGQGSS